MQDLIFLGQVPFTNIYINFYEWLVFMLLVTVVFGAIILVRYRQRMISFTRQQLINQITL